MTQKTQQVDQFRRRLLKFGFFAGVSFFSPAKVFASIPDFSAPERSLWLYNPTTQETVLEVYWSDGYYIPDALAAINHFMRDHRANEVKPIGKGLLNLMFAVKRKLDVDKPIHVISGYRCRKTNDLLRRRGRKAARNSFHLTGEAADIRVPGCRLSHLRSTAIEIKGGGVGYNPDAKFVHIDTGPVRYWSYKKKRS